MAKILSNTLRLTLPLPLCLLLLASLLASTSGELDFNDDHENNKNFKSVPTTIKTFENDTVLLPCYHNHPYHYVRWHRDDVPLIDSRYPKLPKPDRIHLFENGSLQVSNVKAEDTGDYYCEIMSSSSHAVQKHAIEVQYAPSIVAHPSDVLELPIGAVFEMVCETKGVPTPVMIWRVNGRTLDKYQTGNRQSHLFEVKSRSMSGPIECVATNGVGQPAVAGAYLSVLFSPEVSAVQPIVYTKIGQRAHLECIVVAAPAATVHWFQHGLPVASDTHVMRHDTELQSNHSYVQYYTEMKHVLVIKKVTDSDLGKYECRAENKVGFTGINIELTGRPAQCTFKINHGVQNSTSHYLSWQTESLSPIIEFKLKFRQVPSDVISENPIIPKVQWNELTIPAELTVGSFYSTSYTLHGLRPASIYEVTVLARNHFGWSDNSKIVRFATGGEVELPNYSTESELENVSDVIDYENEIQDDPIVHVASMAHNIPRNSKDFFKANKVMIVCFSLGSIFYAINLS